MSDHVEEALEAYLRHVHELGYPRGDALMAVLTTHRFVSRTELARAIELHALNNGQEK